VGIQVSLGQIRTIRVTLIGEVLRPGNYNIPYALHPDECPLCIRWAFATGLLQKNRFGQEWQALDPFLISMIFYSREI